MGTPREPAPLREPGRGWRLPVGVILRCMGGASRTPDFGSRRGCFWVLGEDPAPLEWLLHHRHGAAACEGWFIQMKAMGCGVKPQETPQKDPRGVCAAEQSLVSLGITQAVGGLGELFSASTWRVPAACCADQGVRAHSRALCWAGITLPVDKS